MYSKKNEFLIQELEYVKNHFESYNKRKQRIDYKYWANYLYQICKTMENIDKWEIY